MKHLTGFIQLLSFHRQFNTSALISRLRFGNLHCVTILSRSESTLIFKDKDQSISSQRLKRSLFFIKKLACLHIEPQ